MPPPPPPGSASPLWILHRDPAIRSALERRVGSRLTRCGDPRDTAFVDTDPPAAVLLGVAGDFEAELEFAHRTSRRSPATRWLVLANAVDVDEARRLFDALPGEVAPYAANPAQLREQLRGLLTRRPAPPLSERRRREQLAERFTRWLADLELPDLFIAPDPKRVHIPVLIRGEPGTGRGLLARYLHQFGTGAAPGPFLSLACAESTTVAALKTTWVRETGAEDAGFLTTLCLEEVDRLSDDVQRVVRGWIEHGPPVGVPCGSAVRWIATVGDTAGLPDRLFYELGQALAGMEVRLPPLRERHLELPHLLETAVAAWCWRNGQPRRAFSPAAVVELREHAWAGNLRELEAVVARTLAQSSAAMLTPEELRFPAMGNEPWGGGGDLVAELYWGSATPSRAATVPSPATTARVVSPARPEEKEEEADEELPEVVAEFEAEEPEPDTALESAPESAGDPLRVGAAPSPLHLPRVGSLRRLAGAISHEVGNPLLGIRTFARMLPENYLDAEFRLVAPDRVAADTLRIEAAVEKLFRLGSLPAPEFETVDFAALLTELLAERRPRFEERNATVLEELRRDATRAWADRDQLRFAWAALLDAVLELMPERGDLAIRSELVPGAQGEPGRIRTRVRFPTAGATEHYAELSQLEQNLGLAIAETVVETQGGSLVVDLGASPTATLCLELRAPAVAGSD